MEINLSDESLEYLRGLVRADANKLHAEVKYYKNKSVVGLSRHQAEAVIKYKLELKEQLETVLDVINALGIE